jgi:hypothetical protein
LNGTGRKEVIMGVHRGYLRTRGTGLSVYFLAYAMLIISLGISTAEMTSTQYRIAPQYVGGTGGDLGSANYDLYQTLGQSFAGGELSSSSYRVYPGIWYVFLTPFSPLWAAAVNLGEGWYWLDWFGYFNKSHDPWIYHQEHRFLYPFGTSTTSIVFWDGAMDAFWWTSDGLYPYTFRFSDGNWLWYLEESSEPRWFVNLGTGLWEQL